MLSIRRRIFCGNNPDFDKQSDFLRQESAAAGRNLPLSVFQSEKTKGGIRLAAADCHFRRKKSAGDPASAVRDGRALGYRRGGGRGSGRAAAENGALGCAAAGQPSAGRRRFPVGNAVSGSAAVSPKGAGAVAGWPPPAADCAVPAESGGVRIAALLSVLAKKPLPYLAAAHRAPNRAGGGTLSGCAGHAPGMEGTELCGLVPCAAGSPSPGWISSPSTGCTRNAPKPSGSAPERWSAAFASPWRACSPWAVSPTSSASSARPSTRTRASPPTGPF